MNTEIKIGIGVALFKRTKYFIAYAPALKTFGYGETEDSAFDDLDKALSTFFEVHQHLNTLNEALLNLGWIRTEASIEPPKYFNADISQFKGNFSRRDKNVMIPVC